MNSAKHMENKPLAEIGQPTVKEYTIRLAKKTKRRYNLMRFNAAQKVEFKNWKQVRMQRENNMRDMSRPGEDMPKFGAGSVFGRDAKEEARRRRLGIRGSQYKESDQPWILKTRTGDDKSDFKMFRGTREGGVGANSAYYIFTHDSEGCIDAYPLSEWYNFLPIQRYKMLNAEEAEEEFTRRDKVMNYFSLMMKKRLRNEEEEDDEELLEAKKAMKNKQKSLKISEMDEWMDSDDSSGSDNSDRENKGSADEDDKKKKKKKANLKKKKKNQSDDEAIEESDDGDEEGREREYISDSSASDSDLEEQKEVKSVAEEKGLRKLLASDEEDDDSDSDEEHKEKDDEKEDNLSSSEDGEKKEKPKEKPKSNSKKAGPSKEQASTSNSGNNSNNSSDMDSGSDKQKSASTALSSSQNSKKRPLAGSPDSTPVKKSKLDAGVSQSMANVYIPGSSESGITIEAVTRYLTRKPMTTIDLLKKFKNNCKKTGMTKEEIGHILMLVLSKVNPSKQKVNGVTYYYIKK